MNSFFLLFHDFLHNLPRFLRKKVNAAVPAWTKCDGRALSDFVMSITFDKAKVTIGQKKKA